MYLTGIDVTAVDSTPKFTLGSRYMADDGKEYKYVQLQNTTATVAGASGDVAGYGLSGVNDNLVVTDNSDSQTKPIGAGVIQATVAGVAGTAEYIWVLTTGAFTANQTIAGVAADGDALFLSTTDLTLTVATAVDDPVCAFADDESADECIAAFPR